MKVKGQGVYGGRSQGKVVKVDERVSFLGDVDPETGIVFQEKRIKDSVFVFPGGRGSTVGSYIIYQLKKNGTAPSAMINQETETIVVAGAIISNIPLVDGLDVDLFREGDEVSVDGGSGEVEIEGIHRTPVVTAFLKRGDSVLLLKRSDEVGSFHGRWSAVSGYLEVDNPTEQARTEISEETGLEAELISEGDTVLARGEGKIWEVHPFIFEVQGEPALNWENVEYRWAKPDKIPDMKTVPKLWEAYVSASDIDEGKN